MPIGKQGQAQQMLCTLVSAEPHASVTNGWSCNHTRPLIVEKAIVTECVERFDVAADLRRMILMTDMALHHNY